MKKEISDFIKANVFKRRSLVRCGFELETQSTDGMTKGDGELDDESYQEAINERAESLVNDIPSWAIDSLDSRGLNRINDAARSEAEEYVDADDYRTNPIDSLMNDLSQTVKRNLEIVEDGSVDGFEFRTRGGLTYLEFAETLKTVFDSFEHDIDDRCSFHVHLSIPGIRHQFGTSFQIALNEYLIENFRKLPGSVQRRFQGAPDNQYISALVGSKAKYSFTHAHPSGTWEFRCFGNVQNRSEGMACLNLAIEAMAYAYLVTHANSIKPLTAGLGDEEISTLFRNCLKARRTVTEQLNIEKSQNRVSRRLRLMGVA